MAKVYIIDDSAVARVMLKRMLAVLPDVELAGESGNGSMGLMDMVDASPDVLFLEAAVEGGMSAAEIISGVGRVSPDTAVVLCFDSGRARKELGSFGMSVDFIEKPYNQSKIARSISDIMKAKETVAAPPETTDEETADEPVLAEA